jgi:hypothetical protein
MRAICLLIHTGVPCLDHAPWGLEPAATAPTTTCISSAHISRRTCTFHSAVLVSPTVSHRFRRSVAVHAKRIRHGAYRHYCPVVISWGPRLQGSMPLVRKREQRCPKRRRVKVRRRACRPSLSFVPAANRGSNIDWHTRCQLLHFPMLHCGLLLLHHHRRRRRRLLIFLFLLHLPSCWSPLSRFIQATMLLLPLPALQAPPMLCCRGELHLAQQQAASSARGSHGRQRRRRRWRWRRWRRRRRRRGQEFGRQLVGACHHDALAARKVPEQDFPRVRIAIHSAIRVDDVHIAVGVASVDKLVHRHHKRLHARLLRGTEFAAVILHDKPVHGDTYGRRPYITGHEVRSHDDSGVSYTNASC